ncbi:MAG: hypothetical protein CMN87_12070 [Stappia sp.]|uniref:hypothetical protein n=1 Tax=Stappia sp. TaxID=1870903 RepID=UPI000C65F52E|nr:hypothetical protein [Stappia sp.]MAB00098.1 hypothetical protein [Stappia sp.]MBM20737.1 hypothetical protein [Stappia sp.]
MITPILALFLLVMSAGAASAAPIAAAIVGLIGLTGTAASFATAVIGIGLSLGARTLLSSLLSPSEPDVSPASLGASAELRFGSRVAHELAFGEVITSGHYIYWNTHGANRRYLDQVYVLASGWCDSLMALYVNGESVSLLEVDSGTGWTKYAVTLPDDGGTRRMWVTFWEGRHDQAASPALVANSNPPGRWSTDHIGVGMCYAHVEADYDANLEAFRGLLNGSSLKFRFKGLRLYDARLDTTAGGSGSHRLDDWTTWEWSDNPAVACHHYQLGYFINGVRVVGMGLPAYDLATTHYMAAANVCDESVAVPGGGTEPRYRVAMFASDEVEAVDVVDRLVSAMGGERLERDGIHGVLAGAAQVPVAALTDDDLVAGQPVTFSTRLTRQDLVNELYGQYSDPDQLFELADIEPVIGDTALKSEDGGETRPAPVTLQQVPSATQGRRLLLISFRRGRMQARASIVLGLEARTLEVGDWITWRGRTWTISGTSMSTGDDVIVVSLAEIAASVYAVGAGDVTTVPVIPTPPALPARPTNVSGLLVQATTLTGADGQALPALAVSWDAVADETIRTVEIQYRRDGDTGTGESRTVARPASGTWDGTVIAGGLMAGTDYEVRTSITTFPARRVTWSEWVSVTTGGDFIVGSAGALVDAAGERTRSASEIFNSADTSLFEQIHRIVNEVTGDADRVDRLERTSEHSRAAYTHAVQLTADETAARVTAIETLETELTDQIDGKASVTYVDEAVTSESEARATAINQVEATLNGFFAGGFIRFSANAGTLPSGVVAEFLLQLNAGTEGTPDWKTSGLALQILSDLSSRMAINVDQFVIDDGSGNTVPVFVIDDGRVTINNLVFLNAIGGRIRSADETMDTNYDAGYIRIVSGS